MKSWCNDKEKRREEAGYGLADERERARAVKAINLILIDDERTTTWRYSIARLPASFSFSASLASLIPSTQFPACFCRRRHCRIIVFREPGLAPKRGRLKKIH